MWWARDTNVGGVGRATGDGLVQVGLRPQEKAGRTDGNFSQRKVGAVCSFARGWAKDRQESSVFLHDKNVWMDVSSGMLKKSATLCVGRRVPRVTSGGFVARVFRSFIRSFARS